MMKPCREDYGPQMYYFDATTRYIYKAFLNGKQDTSRCLVLTDDKHLDKGSCKGDPFKRTFNYYPEIHRIELSFRQVCLAAPDGETRRLDKGKVEFESCNKTK